jgi:hypothetical protein
MTDSRQKTAALIFGGLLLWVAVYLITGTSCWIQAFVGMPCPGCGSTRAALELFRGNFAESFAFHPLIAVSLVALPYVVIRSLMLRRRPMRKTETRLLLGVGVLYLAVFAVRMVMLFPHTPPMTLYSDVLIRQVFRLFGLWL